MIAIEELRFGYRGEELFSGLYWGFRPGTMTAVTGPSGSGKSTLLYLLGLFLTPQAGRVLLEGQPVDRLPDRQRSVLRAARVGFVFQDAALDPTRTVLDNVTEGALYAGLGRPEAIRRATELLERFGVELRADHRPGEVSGGQAQRVALCRALIKWPSVILADEPTGNLDRAAAQVVLGALEEAAGEGATVVVASHDSEVARRCSDVLAL